MFLPSISFVFVAVWGGGGIIRVIRAWRFRHSFVVFGNPSFCFFLGVSASFGTAIFRQFMACRLSDMGC